MKTNEIKKAIAVLQKALTDKFGDEAACVGAGEGFSIDIRAGGVDLIGEDSSVVVDDGTPEEIAQGLQ